MVAGALVADGGDRDDDMILYPGVVQHAAGTEQHEFFRAHGDDLLKTCHTGRSAHPGEIEGDVLVFVTDFIDGEGAVGCI